tara:strand:+ start:928 stop:3636 length:2709 start_codon:yes stop_codon:yes gene_type:complete
VLEESKLAQGLYDITPLAPFITAGCTLLTPNYRLARRIKAEWDAQRMAAGEQVWEPLSVQPLESWLLGQWELAVNLGLLQPTMPLDSNQILELWQQVICAQGEQSLDYHLLRPDAAAQIASHARDTLQRWQVDMNDRGLRQSFKLDQDCGTFLQWLVLFEQRLNTQGQCTPVDCLTQLLSIAGQLPITRVALIEFDEISPLEHSVLESLGANVRKFSSASHRTECFAHSFSDKRAELGAVATWAANLHRADPKATIGIVLGDMGGDRIPLEYLLRREFDCLGNNYTSLPVNFSTGIALGQAPLVRDALSTLALGLKQTTVHAVVDVLRSRFLALPDAQSALAHCFVTSLYKEGSERLLISDLRYAAANVSLGEERGLVLARHLRALSEMRELRPAALPSRWVEYFSKILSLFGWPGNQGLDSLEYQQLELWHRTLEEFKTFDLVCKTMHYAEALQLLRDCCHRQISQPQTEDSPIQVLGPLEAAALAFEHLWLTGMQGTSWPASPRPNPFIPVFLQTQLQMPHATPEREWAFSESLVSGYARACQAMHASYCRQIDGVPEVPSALLSNFVVETTVEPSPVSGHWASAHRAGVLETLRDEKAPSVGLEAQSAIKGGSGLLEDQSQCPFRAFARHRLQVEPLGAYTIALSAAQRGSLLHNALYALWGEIDDYAALQALDPLTEQQVIVRAVQSAIDAAPVTQRRRLGQAYWQLESRRLASLLHEWLEVERQRSIFAVVQREQDVTLELAHLKIRLRVDRVDQLPDGSRVIIDYKSGKSKVQDWLGERPAKPQLLLYSIAEPGRAAALAFAQVRPRDCRYVGLGEVEAAAGISTDIPRAVKAQMDAQDWISLNARWRENLERLANGFIAGEAQVAPLSSSSCTWCGLQPLCRVDAKQEIVEFELE